MTFVVDESDSNALSGYVPCRHRRGAKAQGSLHKQDRGRESSSWLGGGRVTVSIKYLQMRNSGLARTSHAQPSQLGTLCGRRRS